MSTLNQDAWLVCYRIGDDTTRRAFVEHVRRWMKARIVLRDHVVVLHSDDQDPTMVWEKVSEYFARGDRCVFYYTTYDGTMEEAVMFPRGR